MQATPQDNTGGIPNDRDAAETEHVHPGQEHDKKIPNQPAYRTPVASASMGHDGSPSIVPNAEANAQRLDVAVRPSYLSIYLSIAPP